MNKFFMLSLGLVLSSATMGLALTDQGDAHALGTDPSVLKASNNVLHAKHHIEHLHNRKARGHAHIRNSRDHARTQAIIHAWHNWLALQHEAAGEVELLKAQQEFTRALEDASEIERLTAMQAAVKESMEQNGERFDKEQMTQIKMMLDAEVAKRLLAEDGRNEALKTIEDAKNAEVDFEAEELEEAEAAETATDEGSTDTE